MGGATAQQRLVRMSSIAAAFHSSSDLQPASPHQLRPASWCAVDVPSRLSFYCLLLSLSIYLSLSSNDNTYNMQLSSSIKLCGVISPPALLQHNASAAGRNVALFALCFPARSALSAAGRFLGALLAVLFLTRALHLAPLCLACMCSEARALEAACWLAQWAGVGSHQRGGGFPPAVSNP